MNKKYFITLFIFLAVNYSFSQSKRDIDYIIKDKEIRIKIERPVIEFSAQLSNSTKINLIMYGFRNSMLMPASIDSSYSILNVKNGGSGNDLYLLHKDGSRVAIWRNTKSPHEDEAFEPKNFVRNLRTSLSELYYQNSEILPTKNKKIIKIKVDLTDTGPLDKGEYLFYMIYVSGQITKDVIGDSTINHDKKKFNAIVFDGYIKSNLVKLIIE